MNPYESPAAADLPTATEFDSEEICLEYDVNVEDIVHLKLRHFDKYRWLDVVLPPAACLTYAGVKLWPDVVESIEQKQIVWKQEQISLLISVPIACLLVTGILRWFPRRWFLQGLFYLTTQVTMLLVGRSRMIGHFQLRANAHEITEVTPQRPFSFPTSLVRKILVTPESVAIVVSPLQTMILIPQRAFASPEQLEQFLLRLQQFTSKPVEYDRSTAVA
jgi:hypothetical protein